MDESKPSPAPVSLKRSRLGPNLKTLKVLRPVVPNGNGLSTSNEKKIEEAPENSSSVDKDKASMSVRNKEICRLHMEETNSINNAQNPDAKGDKSESNDLNKSDTSAADVVVKKEPSDPHPEENNSNSTVENSSSATEQNNSGESDSVANNCVSKVNSTSSEESSKTSEENGKLKPSDEASDDKVEKITNEEIVKAEIQEDSASSDASKLKDSTQSEAVKPVKEPSAKTEVSKPVKESPKAKALKKEAAKTDVPKPADDKVKVEKDSVKSEEKAAQEVAINKTETKSEKDLSTKAKGKTEAEPAKRESARNKANARKGKLKDEESQSSGSEDFLGFDSEHTEKSMKAKKKFIESSEEKKVSSSRVPSTPVSTDTSKSENSFLEATPSSNKKMRKNIVDISDPRYLKPFEFGWRRELVYRATNEDGKRQGDIYYYTPSGKKVRSQREVSEHITDPELTADNFTFSKEPIGLNDSEKEIIRDAKMRMSKDFATPPPRAAMKTPKAKATATPPATPKTTPKVVIKTPTPSSGGLKVKFTGIKSGSTAAKSSVPKSRPAKVKKRKSSGSSELEMGMLPPMWSSPEAKNDDVSTARSWSPPTVSDSSKVEMDRSCSIYCPRAMGIIPSLQCHACQCLFHPECCGISPGRTILQYVCKKCQKNWNWKARTLASTMKSGNSITVSLPAPKSTLVSLSSSAPTKSLTTSTIAKTAKITSIVGGVTTWLPPSSTIQFSSSNVTTKAQKNPKSNTPSVPRPADSQSTAPPAQAVVEMNGKRFIVMPKQNVVSVSQPMPVSNPDDNPPPPVPVTAIQCFPRPPAQFMLPSSESLALAPISTPNLAAGGAFLPHFAPGLTPGAFLMSSQSTNPPGVLLVPCLPQQSALGEGMAVQPQYVLVNGAGVGGNLMFGNPLPQSSDDKENVGKKRSAERGDAKKGSPPSKRARVANNSDCGSTVLRGSAPVVTSGSAELSGSAAVVTTTTTDSSLAQLKPSHYFMMNLAAGYSTLMHIFRYLNLKELLVASRVCRLWHDVASKQHFWQTVRMKNTQVSDWKGFANALIKHETKHLDLRKMLVGTKTEEVKNNWLEFYNVIGQVKSLKRIELCRCLSSVIENLAKHVPHIEALTATSIKNTSLNLEPLAAITNLTELRLKGMSGIELSFNHLSNLTTLKLLSITGIKNLDSEASQSIGSLVNLEQLEIGDCNNIHQVTVTEALPKLINLKRLRLEKGQNSVPLIIQLIESASQLPALEILELINFDVKPGFEEALKKCTNIKSLLMIPTYITQSATTNHIVMVGVSHLKQTLKNFVWGLTLELLRVTDLFIDQCETAKNSPAQSPTSNGSNASKKGKGDSIPILKPLIDTLEEGRYLKEPIQIPSTGPSKVDILPIPKLRKVLSQILPTTEIKILKIPFNQTWRQTLV
nr:PREDICTED: proteoglycan 4-like isoform X1 [Bemisia tabaci]